MVAFNVLGLLSITGYLFGPIETYRATAATLTRTDGVSSSLFSISSLVQSSVQHKPSALELSKTSVRASKGTSVLISKQVSSASASSTTRVAASSGIASISTQSNSSSTIANVSSRSASAIGTVSPSSSYTKAASSVLSLLSSRISSTVPSSLRASSLASSLIPTTSQHPFPSSSANVLYFSGCPPITLNTTTITDSRFSFSELYTATTTVSYAYNIYELYTETETSLQATLTVLETFTSTVLSSTITETAITVIPATATVTQPTSAGFTPLLCEPIWFNVTPSVTYTEVSISTVTTVSTASVPVVSTVSVTSTSTVYGATTTTTTPYTVFVPATTTLTSTRNEPTSTIYDACASNNVSPNDPRGGYLGLALPAQYTVVGALDAVDCCAQCQATPKCAGNLFSISEDNLGLCALTSNPSTCDSSFVFGSTFLNTTTPHITISNGLCGQWAYGPLYIPF